MRTQTRQHRSSGIPSFAAFAAATAAAAAAGSGASPKASVGRRTKPRWYRTAKKPSYQPPDWIYGPTWGLLYGSIAASGWMAYRGPKGKARKRALRLWWLQLALNGLWPWLFFGMRRPRAALVDSALLLGTSAAFARSVRRVDRRASRLFVPYLGWLAFVTILNGDIVRRNPRIAKTPSRRLKRSSLFG